MAKRKLGNYKFYPGIGLNENVYPDAYSLLTQNIDFIKKEVSAWIAYQVAQGNDGFVGYTYDDAKCQRDTGYNLDAYAHDLRYGGNEETRRIASTYWEREVAQVDGDRQAEIKAKEFTRDLINNHVFTNSPQTTPYQTGVAQVVDNTKTAESATGGRIQTLVGIVIDVLTNGLDSLPTLIRKGLGHVRIQGNYTASDILLITNTTTNEVIANFSDPDLGFKIKIKRDDEQRDSSGYTEKYDDVSSNRDADDDFPKYLQVTDAVSIVDLVANTEGQSVNDFLQIFVEEQEIRTRPYDFGTDAIERMRVATPLSMLDADFEYGLQPTKWSAIATMRGYPSVYEIPGTDTQVSNVVTDASEGTDGIGASLITVTTVGAHGFDPGTPITIKALEDAVVGAARAEGSFIITTVPSNTTFTFYAKAKVGTNDGDVLSTTYTQLRKANFFTGADVGVPEFTVNSNGTEGTMTLALAAGQGVNRLAFTGDVPEIGAPVNYPTAVPVGSQVTAVSSTPDGSALTLPITTQINNGTTSFDVNVTTGIVPGLAVDNGDDTAIYVSTIVGNTVTMSGQFTQTLDPWVATYQNVTGTTVGPGGSNAEFNMSRTAGVYTVEAISQAGTGYAVGDQIKILGTALGGFSPANDAVISITSVNSGAITGTSVSGTALDGSITYDDLAGTHNHEGGTLTTIVDVDYESGSWTNVTLGSPDDSSGFAVHDRLKIPGSQFGAGGSDGSQTDGGNDLIAKVTSVGGGGSISGITIDQTDWALGTPPVNNRSYEFGGVGLSFTGGAGTGLEFRVTTNSTNYDVQITNQGTGYTTADVIVASGTDLGGASPANDVYLRINDVGGSGEVLSFRLEGPDLSSTPVAVDAGSFVGKNISPWTDGTGALFDISNDGSTYTVTVANGGSGYFPDQTFTVSGADLGGSSPANDATVTISTVLGGADAGEIDTATVSGTVPTLANTFTSVSGTNEANTGTGAQFDITKTGSSFSAVALSSGNGGGSDYRVGNRITVSGTDLGGATPANDATITITGIGASNEFNTGTVAGTALAGDEVTANNSITMSEVTTAAIPNGTAVPFEALATLQIDFDNDHGIVPGNTFITSIDTDDTVNNHSLAAGSFIATQVPSKTRILFNARAPGTIDLGDDANPDPILGAVYLRPDSFFIHRPYDGGVQLGTAGPQHGAQAIRQSKKYIRYQSGKGIMYTTGALFAPSYDIRTATANGTGIGAVITVTTDGNDHGLQVGGGVRLQGIETPGYNGNYEVNSVIDERQFTVLAKRRLGNATAVIGFAAQITVTTWHGATVRSGIFDDQNGIFWEYDGKNLSVVQRTSTKQIAGTINISPDSSAVTGTNTRFRDQLSAGDRIVIRGMTHVVSHVNSQTSMSVTPDYRGVSEAKAAKVCLVFDKKVLQQDWNRDKLDGTGESGYKIDTAYMQMIGIQYTWYGAGFIDWMLRGQDGNFIFCHRMRNSNVNTEAFMRSGNLPVRYEITNEGTNTKLKEAMDATQTTMTVESSKFLPDSGTLYVDNEIITYTSNNTTTNVLSGLTRATSLTNYQAGATRQYTAGSAAAHDARTGVILISNTITPLISHWGSAFLTDGLFDEDRGYIFSYTERNVPISTTRETAFLLRLAPSVSNAIVGDLGDRELLNRAQLLMQSIEVTSDALTGGDTGGIVVEGVLNPQNYPTDPALVGWSGLSGVAQGGQPSFAQVAAGGSIVWDAGGTVTTDTATVINKVTVDVAPGGGGLPGLQNQQRGRNYIDFQKTAWDAANVRVGDTVEDGDFPSGTTVTQVIDSYISNSQGTVNRVYFSNFPTANRNAGSYTVTFSVGGDIENRNFVLLPKADVDDAGIKAGTILNDPPTDQSDISFPAGTYVSKIDGPYLFGASGNQVEYYRVEFNSTFSGTVSPGDVFNFRFELPPFAQPGETVFSFIANPGERSVLDLGNLKELTNTTLGGRGTFPNGPDVLAINVYKTEGNALNGNIIIKWGEAQA